MIIVYELAAIGAAAIAAATIWHNARVQRRIRAIDMRLTKMQKEIVILQTQESRRVMRALKGNSGMEAPGLDPGDNEAPAMDGDVVRLIGKPRTMSVP